MLSFYINLLKHGHKYGLNIIEVGLLVVRNMFTFISNDLWQFLCGYHMYLDLGRVWTSINAPIMPIVTESKVSTKISSPLSYNVFVKDLSLNTSVQSFHEFFVLFLALL